MIEFKSDNLDTITGIIRKIDVTPTIGKKRILNLACSFDTEASSFYTDVIGDEVGLVYIWMFGADNEVIYGRTLDDFQKFIVILNSYLEKNKCKLIVYVHNFKYDFQFIRTYFKWDTVFMKAKRNPLYARYRNIEFRDSLVLSGGRSLAYIGEHLKSHSVTKAVGDLDYSLLRHSKTPLTATELGYCERDILTLNAYISEKIEEDGDITKIPYTNTGYVRNFVKNVCLFEHGERYRSMIDGLTLTPGAYQQCERAFVGGAVGPNNYYTDKLVNNVVSYDIKSSYPYVMVTQTFPMGYPEPVTNKEAASYLSRKDYHCIFRLTVHDLHPKEGNNYCYPISQDKCINLIGARVVSNRVIDAASLSIECTELDYDTFKKFYNITPENSRITNMRAYPAGRLPRPIICSVFEFFNKKTTLDGVVGSESEYMISKNMLNAIYGMMVERPIRPKFMYIDGRFVRDDIDYVAQIEGYNEKRDRVLYYPWGVYVTAHARHRLYDAIYNMGNRFVYCDTDSVKWKLMGGEYDIERYEYFNRVNKQAEKAILDVTKELKLSPDYTMPCDPLGHKKILGVWEREYIANNFKTIGAKRYMYDIDGKYHLTVAGTNKKSTLDYILLQAREKNVSPYYLFTENLVIPKEYSKRLIATYVDEEAIGYVTDYLGNRAFYDAPSGVHMVNSQYTFSYTDSLRSELARILGEETLDLGEIEE